MEAFHCPPLALNHEVWPVTSTYSWKSCVSIFGRFEIVTCNICVFTVAKLLYTHMTALLFPIFAVKHNPR